MKTLHEYRGRCRCGNLGFRFYSELAAHELPARRCGCSFCAERGDVYTSDPDGEMEYRVRDESLVRRHQFGTNTAEFLICAGCGDLTLALSELEGRTYGLVNLNLVGHPLVSAQRALLVDHGHETLEQRLARRKRTWIPKVRRAAAESAEAPMV